MIFPQPENHAGAATTLPLSACAVGEKPGMYGSPEENAGEPWPGPTTTYIPTDSSSRVLEEIVHLF